MYIDGGVFWGREPKYGLTNEAIDMNRISLVTHTEAIFYDMISGNERTLHLAHQYPDNVIPLAVINPLHYDAKSSYLNDLERKGFKGVCLLTHYQYGTLDQFVVRTLADQCNKLGLPVQVGVASLTDLTIAATTFGGLKIPVLIRSLRGGGYSAVADEIAIAKEYKNIVFDVGNLVSLDAIPYLAETIGSDRLYVASNWPFVYRSTSQILVEQSRLSKTDFFNIQFGTLAKIFKISTRKFSVDPSQRQKFAAELAQPKIDIHWHSEGWDLLEPGKGIKAMQRIIKQCSYQALITSSILALNYDLVQGNRNTQELIETNERVYGWIVIDPTRIKESLQELNQYAKHKKFLGMKTIQDYYPVGLDDERYKPLLELAHTHKLPVLAHLNGLAQAAKNFPDVTFIAAHCTYERMKQIKDLPNVFLDISASYAHRGETNIEGIVEAVGANRVLYSSDGPLISPLWAMGKLVDSSLSQQARKQIYYENARSLFPNITL